MEAGSGGRAHACARLSAAFALAGGLAVTFVHLAGIHTLSMWGCNQATITDVAFVHLAGIHTLDIRWYDQATITAAGRARLAAAGIPKLL